MTQNNANLNILHISDLHYGMKQQNWMLPNFKTELFRDFGDLADRAGAWDLVIFSGDLTQKGTKEEYSNLSQFLSEMWKCFGSLGFNPSLFVVPGNHDLMRPAEDDPYAIALEQYWDNSKINSNFFAGATPGKYRETVNLWFNNYQNWLAETRSAIDVLGDKYGMLTGDSSAIFKKGELSLGLVGLNSTWLQYGPGNYEGRIGIHPMQLMNVTDDNPDGWRSSNDFNLIVTHHPKNWLHPRALELWKSEIDTPSRFDAHLFGHMHTSSSETIAHSGSAAQHSIQSASLFGLEHFGEANEDRQHGYSILQLNKEDDRRYIRIWPRKLVPKAGGRRGLSASPDWTLVKDSYCDLKIENGSRPIRNIPSIHLGNKLPDLIEKIGTESLKKLIRPYSNLPAHRVVREAERTLVRAELEENRSVWIVSDWGLAADEFLATVQESIASTTSFIYYIDINGCHSIQEICDTISEKNSTSFGSFCAGLSDIKNAVLVLDDASVDSYGASSTSDQETIREIEQLVGILRGFCNELSIIIRSRVTPGSITSLKVVELLPLDEPDTREYISAHPDSPNRNAIDGLVSRIFLHTDGIPQRLDLALRDILINGANSLHEINVDLSVLPPDRIQLQSVKLVVDDLASSLDLYHTRAFELLKVLCIFPHGVQLSRIKRFNGSRGFHSENVEMLRQRAFIDAVEVTNFGVLAGSSDDGRMLVVRRPIREYVLSSMKPEELAELNKKAVELYFGSDWAITGISTPPNLNLHDSRCEVREIVNTTTLVFKEVKDAIYRGNQSQIKNAVILATSYAAKIKVGGHFRHVVALFDDLLPLLRKVEPPVDLTLALTQHAQCLRMIDEKQRALDLLIQLDNDASIPKRRKQQILLSLALTYNEVGERDIEATETAKRCVALNPKSFSGMQASGIIIGNEKDAAERKAKLLTLKGQATAKKAHTVANNIAINLAAESKNPSEKENLLSSVLSERNRREDPYNYVRATINRAELEINAKGRLSREKLISCMAAYSYLHNQRLDSLFGKCHNILWRHFASERDLTNLLDLFRHSSLIWRLRGSQNNELSYLNEITPLLENGGQPNIRTIGRDLLYLLTRLKDNKLIIPSLSTPGKMI